MKHLLILLFLFSGFAFGDEDKPIISRGQDKDIIFSTNQGGTVTEAMRIDGATGDLKLKGEATAFYREGTITFVDGDTSDIIGTGNHSGTIYYKIIGSMLYVRVITSSDANIYSYSIPLTIITNVTGGVIGGGYRGPDYVYRSGNNTYYAAEIRTAATILVFNKTGSSSVSTSFIWTLPPIHLN